MKRFAPATLRTKLTLWYLLVLGAVVLLYAAGTSVALLYYLRHELDETLAQDIEGVEGLLARTPDGSVRLASGRPDPDASAEDDRLIEVRALSGALLYRSPNLEGESLGDALLPDEGREGYSARTIHLPHAGWIRLASRLQPLGATPVLIRLGESEQPLRREFGEMLAILLLGLPLALAVAALGGYGLARRALAPVDRMARRAEKLSAERLHERLPIENPRDELGQLARVFNQTLARLEQSFDQLRRFTADASHELRTPLTAIRSVGEMGLRKTGDADYFHDVIGSMLEEANRLTRLVDSLLTLSRADAGAIPLHPADVKLMALVREAADLLQVLAEEKSQRLTVSGDAGVGVRADRVILRQALLNLIDNALKYSPAGAAVTVRVRSDAGDDAVVEVQDDGPGIGAEHRARIFDRFYRAEAGRSRASGGAGLGLAIARWAIEVNGGSIAVESELGHGALFRVRLPRAQVRTQSAG